MSSPEARAARDRGMAMAADHAERVTPGWGEEAYSVLLDFLTKPPACTDAFTSEHVREHGAALALAEPPHRRAWGPIFQRAAKAGMIEKAGFTTARAANVHCAIITVWRATRGR